MYVCVLAVGRFAWQACILQHVTGIVCSVCACLCEREYMHASVHWVCVRMCVMHRESIHKKVNVRAKVKRVCSCVCKVKLSTKSNVFFTHVDIANITFKNNDVDAF